MPTNKIREFLLGHPGFQRRLDDVIRAGVSTEFPTIDPSDLSGPINWKYMMLCASALARSDEGEEQRIALRLADTCLKAPSSSEGERMAATVVLDVMANQRAANLAIERSLIKASWEDSLPLPLRADQLRRHSEDSIKTADGEYHAVNRFQREFWKALNHASQISASAPTSAGKSFILRMWVAEKFYTSPNSKIVVVVPTRALIQEFADEFNQDLESGKLVNVSIHTLPLDGSIEKKGGHLCVFTQERLHILLGRSSRINFDLVIIDEAQKVGDGYRGILLEQVLDECQKRNPNVQMVYASPFSENPGYLMRNCLTEVVAEPVEREVTTVTQNLLFASQKRGNVMEWGVSFENDDKQLDIGTFTLPFRPTPDSKRLSMVALAIGAKAHGNLVYANGAADAEKFAQHIADGIDNLTKDKTDLHPRVVELIKLVKKTVHKSYLLATTLKHGVAYHYGNMPLLIRTEIEGLFRENIIRYLVCTGTLIEGVNLPCRVIFLRAPTKGRGHPMQPQDFWNLAGRAGRWGKEFHGTIVCVDTKKTGVWKEPPPKRRVRQKIQSSMDDCLVNAKDLMCYIRDGYPIAVADKHPEYDYSLSFLFHLLVRDDGIHAAAKNVCDPLIITSLDAALRSELDSFQLPRDFVFAHPGILPATMAGLLKTLERLSDDELIALSPVQPESDDANIVYLKILGFINLELRARWAIAGAMGESRLKQLAYMMVDWMQGMPLAVLIRTREKIEKWKGDQGREVKRLAPLIIQVMKDVEEYARFKIPKYLKAFLDILYFHAAARGLEDRMLRLPDLELWLELGVSTQTQLALMELGLSRTSTIELMEVITNNELSKESALKWLQEANIEGFSLPGPVVSEINRVLGRYKIAQKS
jgi:hypothetical protein